MCDLSKFYTVNPPSRRVRPFSEEEIAGLSTVKIPDEIVDFLKSDGLSAYHDDFFWTTLPQDHFQTFSDWGLNGKKCFAFLKTALGGLIFYHKNEVCRLNPFTGYVLTSGFDFCSFMNLLLTMDSILESCYLDIYQKIKADRLLKEDEMFAPVPALPLGGSFETSKFEVVKMREQLAFLAQLFDNKVRKL